ncbi:M23 family metallopeptidase [Microbacterium sp.]|uniref:M23 family metallopeptidase n=2 Tax=Microbacterium sp. TaxID=51671 RepID=UPI0025E015C8|nr:M23 family metallopeptidase [Microbacterium sp.]
MLDHRADVSVDPPIDPDECDCAPSARERRSLWPSLMSRRGALAVGALGVAALGMATAPTIPPAYAATYPSWPDVQRAKANQAAKQAEVSRIQGLINGLKSQVATTQAAAEKAGNEFYEAQQAFYEASARYDDLAAQAKAQAAKAQDAADKAGQVAAQLYRNGGDDTSLQLFFSGSAASADDLLARLGTMDKLLEANKAVYADAVTARDSAQSLTDQAKAQREARDRLQQVAQDKMVAAQQASEAAQAALAAQSANLDTLNAQLAALRDTTAKTVAAYQAGVAAARKAAAEKAARDRAAAEKAARDAAAHSGSGAGSPTYSGWCRPSNGWQSSGYGPRSVQCGNGYCASGFHAGVDLADGCGTAIFAACSGRVVYAGYNGGYGNFIKIDHGDGTGSGYGHIMPGGILVGYGQYVQAGQLIAREGNTGNSFGCHLHFETYINNRPVNPVPFMAARGVSV